MAHFGRRRGEFPRAVPEVPGLALNAAARGWQPLGPTPFDEHVVRPIHEITRTAYGAPRAADQVQIGVGATEFSDAYRCQADGRVLTVANARTFITPGLFQAGRPTPAMAICTVELSTMMPAGYAQPRHTTNLMTVQRVRTGNPEFDSRFHVAALPGSLLHDLTPGMVQRMLAHDDWYFWTGRDTFGCASKGKYQSPEDVDRRIAEVTGILDAAGGTVPSATPADHSVDDVVARFAGLGDVQDAIPVLMSLTDDERSRLARSGTPLAAFADVRSLPEAYARFQALGPQDRMKLVTIFAKVRHRG
jgi:hypothetical protein